MRNPIDKLEEQMDALVKEAKKLQRSRSLWNRVHVDQRLDELRAEYAEAHADWKRLKAQEVLF